MSPHECLLIQDNSAFWLRLWTYFAINCLQQCSFAKQWFFRFSLFLGITKMVFSHSPGFHISVCVCVFAKVLYGCVLFHMMRSELMAVPLAGVRPVIWTHLLNTAKRLSLFLSLFLCQLVFSVLYSLLTSSPLQHSIPNSSLPLTRGT